MSNIVNAGDKFPFFLEAGAWFTASGGCEVIIDRGARKIRQKIHAAEQQIGPFLKDAQVLIEASALTTLVIYPAEAWVPASQAATIAALAEKVDSDTLAGDNGTTGVGRKAPGTGGVLRTLDSILGGLAVDVADYGGYLNGTDDDSTALLRACNAAAAIGSRIVTWRGYLRLNSGFVAPTSLNNIKLAPKPGAYLYAAIHGFDMLTLDASISGWVLEDVNFTFGTAATDVTERFLLRTASLGLITKNLTGANAHSGVYTSGPVAYFLGRTYFIDSRAVYGMGFKVVQAGEICEIENLQQLNASGLDTKAGVWVKSGNAIVIGGLCAKGGTPLLVDPDSGQTIATLTLNNFNGDTSSGHGARFAGAGIIQRVEGSLRCSSNATYGLLVENIPISVDLKVRAVDNGFCGVQIPSGNNKNARYVVTAYGNSVHGFEAVSGATDWSADVVAGDGDDFGGNTQYGAVVGAACDHFDIKASGRGNGIGLAFSGAAATATAVYTLRG